MSIYNPTDETYAEARALISEHGPTDHAVMMTTDQMWTILTVARPAVRDYLLGRWSDGARCFLMDHDGELESLRGQVRSVAAIAETKPGATGRALREALGGSA